MLYVTNPEDAAITLQSFDGDSIQIQPKAKSIPIEQKFDWRIATSGLYYESDALPSQPVVNNSAGEPAVLSINQPKK